MSQVKHRRQATLDVCGCGRLHLTYGALTLHFERDEFVQFAHELEHMSQYLTTSPGAAHLSPDVPTRCH